MRPTSATGRYLGSVDRVASQRRSTRDGGARGMDDGFAGRLASLMAERGLGVLALARRVPCDKALISRIAAGKQRPSAQIAHRLDGALEAGGELAALAAAAVSAAGIGELDLIELARRQEVSDVGNGT